MLRRLACLLTISLACSPECVARPARDSPLPEWAWLTVFALLAAGAFAIALVLALRIRQSRRPSPVMHPPPEPKMTKPETFLLREEASPEEIDALAVRLLEAARQIGSLPAEQRRAAALTLRQTGERLVQASGHSLPEAPETTPAEAPPQQPDQNKASEPPRPSVESLLPGGQAPEDPEDERFLRELVGIVEAHLDSPALNAELVSKKIGMSHSVLYKKVKAIAGMTYIEFVRNYRLAAARRLIAEQGLSVSEACYKVGYSDKKYFSRQFKQRFGRNPSEFRPPNG